MEHLFQTLEESKKNKLSEKQDLVSIITSEGMSSAGGLTPQEIQDAIQKKLDTFTGHWDFENNTPEKQKGYKNPWKKEVGSILAAYYELDEIRDMIQKAEQAEKAIDLDHARIAEAKQKLEDARNELEEFGKYAEALAAYSKAMELKTKYETDKKNYTEDLNAYPKLEQALQKANKLAELKNAKTVIDKYTKVKQAQDKLVEKKESMKGLFPVVPEDENRVSELTDSIRKNESKLGNLNLAATVKKLGDAEIQIRSVTTGKLLDYTDGTFDITETVEITIPGIMSITLAPKGIDVEGIQKNISADTAEMQEILSKYQAKDARELKTKKKDFENLENERKLAENNFRNALEGDEFETLKGMYEACKDAEIEGLEAKIQELCGTLSPGEFAAAQKTKLEAIEKQHGTENTLLNIQKKLEETKALLNGQKEQEQLAESIPEKYREIKNTDSYKKGLNENITAAMTKLDEEKNALRDHEKALGDTSAEELRAKADDLEAEFLKQKTDCARWQHILDVLQKVRAELVETSTMSDVQNRFADYLSVITDGRLLLHSMDENMDINLCSAAQPMTYELLSEGTKDTIALAFRLAMLEHLFPDGGGLVVFDDPFTDMDEDRIHQACGLVQKFADAGNQVLFVTCDNKYKNLMQGNVIEMQEN